MQPPREVRFDQGCCSTLSNGIVISIHENIIVYMIRIFQSSTVLHLYTAANECFSFHAPPEMPGPECWIPPLHDQLNRFYRAVMLPLERWFYSRLFSCPFVRLTTLGTNFVHVFLMVLSRSQRFRFDHCSLNFSLWHIFVSFVGRRASIVIVACHYFSTPSKQLAPLNNTQSTHSCRSLLLHPYRRCG